MTFHTTNVQSHPLLHPNAEKTTPNAALPETPQACRQVSFIGSPPITAQDRLNVSSTSSDDQTAITLTSLGTFSMHRTVSLTSQLSENELPSITYH